MEVKDLDDLHKAAWMAVTEALAIELNKNPEFLKHFAPIDIDAVRHAAQKIAYPDVYTIH